MRKQPYIPYFVSRQTGYGEPGGGPRVVEIARGGSSHAGPDMVAPLFRGEGEYASPIDAFSKACQVRQEWQAKINQRVGLVWRVGDLAERITVAEARTRAKKIADLCPRCGHCGDILGKQTYTHSNEPDEDFCSDFCAEKSYEESVNVDVLHEE